jgi:integrase
MPYPYLRRPIRVKPKPKEVRHESFPRRQDLDGLSPVAFKKNTLRSYESVITPFCRDHGNRGLEELTVDLVQAFLESITNGRKPQTRKIRFAHLTSFFNFIHNNLSPDFQSPCNSPMLRKLFRPKITTSWNIIEKDAVDEIIFRSAKTRNRLILELMARGGMRIGEVLKLTASDLQDRKLNLREPKSGREREVVFIPQKVADRLREYAANRCKTGEDRIFPISYETARMIVAKAGKMVGVPLRPHDLRRYAATYASRSGVPIEIVSKVILRHSNLSTTQRYLGKITDTEAMRWIENLYA